MEEYYKKLLAGSKNKKHREYYMQMLSEIQKPKVEKKTQKWRRVFVGELNKTFRSARKASYALGKDKNYVWKLMKNKLPNIHNIEYLSE